MRIWLFFVFVFASYLSSIIGSENNVFIYICSVCVCISLCLLIFGILSKKNIPSQIVISIKLLSVILMLFWLLKGYFYETVTVAQRASNYIRHNIPCIIYFGMLIIFSLLLAMIVSGKMKVCKHINFLICILLLISIGIVSYQPAVFNEHFGTIYHVHAYTNSIINVLRGAPFSENCFSIYGHYGIIYWFPVKLLSILGLSELNAIMLTIALIMVMQYAMFFYVARKRLENDIIFLIAIIASISPILQVLKGGAYFQAWPHRTFPIVVLLFALTISNGSKLRLRNWLVVVAAIIWNNEIGLVCGGVLMAYDILYHAFAKNAFSVKILLREIVLGAFALFVSFFTAMLIVNVYNILNGGGWNGIKQFIYPIENSEYNIAGLSIPWPKVYGWIWGILLIMLLYLVLGLTKILIYKNIGEETIFTIIISLAGLGKIVYYMNRAADPNRTIIHFES